MKMFRAGTGEVIVSDETVRKEYERRNKKTQASYLLIDPQAFAKDVPVNEPDIKTYYDEHHADFLTADSVNVSYMTIETPEKATDADQTRALDQAREIRKKLLGDADFAAVAKESGLTVQETGLISMEDSTTRLGWPLELLQKVFEAKINEVLGPTVTSQGVVIARITDLKPAYIPEFEKVEEMVKERIREEKAGALAQARADEIQKDLATRLAANTTFDKAATAIGETVKKTPFFALGDYIPEIGISEDFGSAALELGKDKRLSGVVKTAKGPAILYWEADEPIDDKKFAEVKADFAKTLNEEERIAAMNKIIREVKERAKLESYLDKLKRNNK